MAEQINLKKRLILKEDINFDVTGNGEKETFFADSGTPITGQKINASHIPLTAKGREKTNSVSVDEALQNVAEKIDNFTAADVLSEDTEVVFSTNDNAEAIQNKINQQKKNLNGHTLTFLFPASLSQKLYSSLQWTGFYNGTVIIAGGSADNKISMFDQQNITALFRIIRCQCEVIIRYFYFVHQYSEYGISAESSSAVIIENCNFSGIENADSYAVNKSVSNVFLKDCGLSEDIEFFPEEAPALGGLPIGAIFPFPASIPPEGAYLLNGQTIANCKTLYPKFWQWVQTARVRIIDNATYEAELASAGVCGGFAVDSSAGSVRLPSVTQGTLWGADNGNIGQSLAAGLPNITGRICVAGDAGVHAGYGGIYSCSGAFIQGETSGGSVGASDTWGGGSKYADFDASASSDIFGNSDTVQPPAIRVSWCIQVFNAATALSEQESAQLASEMQMKAQTDLGNVTANLDFIVEHWEDGNGGWYDRYRSGKLEQGGIFDYGSYAFSWEGLVTLWKSFANTKYSVLVSWKDGNTNEDSLIIGGISASKYTQDGFSIFHQGAQDWADNARYVVWRAVGKAETE